MALTPRPTRLDIAQVRLLKRVRDGTVHLASAGDTEKMRPPELRNAGLIVATAAETVRGARWGLTEDVRYSLLLDEPSHEAPG